jgi:hypothetical protein
VAAADLGLVAAVDVTQAVAVTRAADLATAARAATGATTAITGALAVVTLAVVTPAAVTLVVMIPEMVIFRKLMMLAVTVESGATDAQTAGRAPTRSNATVTLQSFGRRQWARAAKMGARSSRPRDQARSSYLPSH